MLLGHPRVAEPEIGLAQQLVRLRQLGQSQATLLDALDVPYGAVQRQYRRLVVLGVQLGLAPIDVDAQFLVGARELVQHRLGDVRLEAPVSIPAGLLERGASGGDEHADESESRLWQCEPRRGLRGKASEIQHACEDRKSTRLN